MSKGVVNVSESCHFPFGYTMTDNRIEDYLQRLLSPGAYVVWRQYLRFWGGNKESAAYPSLSYLSERTGMSEKTIRKCNRELVEKNFMLYISGNSKKSNQYYHIPIEKIMTIHYGNEYGPEGTLDKENNPVPPVKQKDQRIERKIKGVLDSLDDENRSTAEDFLNIFKTKYKSKMGAPYVTEYTDVSTLVSNLENIKQNYKLYTGLIERYFDSKNKYIEISDYSIHFMFVPKVIKALISEYYQTNYGRWLSQANKIAEKLERELQEKRIEDKDEIVKYIEDNVNFSGANQERDKFVYERIIEKLLNKSD